MVIAASTAERIEQSWTPPNAKRRVKTTLPPEYRQNTGHDAITTFLGLFSLGLGAAEMIAPRQVSKAIGAKHSPALLQSYGLREIVAGIGILASRDPTFWLWSRVAGDALDLATLGTDIARRGQHHRQRLVASTLAVAGITVLDILSASANKQGTCNP